MFIYKLIGRIFSPMLNDHGYVYSHNLKSNIHPSVIFQKGDNTRLQIGYDYTESKPYSNIYKRYGDFFRPCSAVYGDGRLPPEYKGCSKVKKVEDQLRTYCEELEAFLS